MNQSSECKGEGHKSGMMGSLGLVLGLCLPSLAASQWTVQTSKGSVAGVDTGVAGVQAFLSVPYAKAPVGDLRFKPPVAADAWTDQRSETRYPPFCASYFNRLTLGVNAVSEDCLYLNVFTTNTSAKLPVMVWIHGGCYTSGGSGEFPIDGIAANLVARGVVVVSINYRLGVFGFLTSKTQELPSNLAIQDMVRALQWVRAEISAFGGDPAQVTIFGESAGAAATNLLTYAPAARGLFHKAVSQSGSAVNPALIDGGFDVFHNQSRTVVLNSTCATEANWKAGKLDGVADCLRKLNASAMMSLGGVPIQKEPGTLTCMWVPVVDPSGDILPDWPRNLASNRTKDMPVLLGTNHDEMIKGPGGWGDLPKGSALFELAVEFYVLRFFQPQLRAEIEAAVKKAFDYKHLVMLNSDEEWWMAATKLAADAIFYQSTEQEVRLLAETTSNVYLYSFDYVNADFPWTQPHHGVWHFMDCVYLFNFTQSSHINQTWTKSATDLQMVDVFGTLWTNFAKSGDPNEPVDLEAGWQKIGDAKAPRFLSLRPQPAMANGTYEPQSEWLWETFLPSLTGWLGPTLPPKGSNSTTPRPALPTEAPLAGQAATPDWALYGALAAVACGLVLGLIGLLLLCLRRRK